MQQRIAVSVSDNVMISSALKRCKNSFGVAKNFLNAFYILLYNHFKGHSVKIIVDKPHHMKKV